MEFPQLTYLNSTYEIPEERQAAPANFFGIHPSFFPYQLRPFSGRTHNKLDAYLPNVESSGASLRK